MLTLFNRRRRRRNYNMNDIMSSNARATPGPKRAASLPPTRLQRQGGFSQNNLNNQSNNRNANMSGEYSEHLPAQNVNLLYGELPWHVSHSDVYGISAGAQQNFPEVQKMPLFGSVPALHQMNSMNGDVNNNNVSGNAKRKLPDSPSATTSKQGMKTSPENNNMDENFLRYFNLRQPVNLAGSFQPKVIVHEVKGDEENRRNSKKCCEPTMVMQPLSLMPDWR